MAAEKYTFTGGSQVGYYAYTDLATDRMLIAEPGRTYSIRATEEGSPVPPPDGRWTAVTSALPSPLPAAKPLAAVPAASEGAAA